MRGGSNDFEAGILIVDDEAGAREALEVLLEDRYRVVSEPDGRSGLERLRRERFDVVLLDITMPEMDGIEVLQRIKKLDESIDVIMVSGADRAKEATASMKFGAYDYITKPFDSDEILNTVERAVRKQMLEREVHYLRSEVALKFEDSQIISRSESMQRVFDVIEKVAVTSSNVLITGESGTGKELIARAIHSRSPRAARPFVAINCAAIPPELMESELFGHEKGAFTGAYTRNIGKFEYAGGGTLFLDEISSLRKEFQAKLLRFLQEREFTRVGSHRSISVDVRVIAATNLRLDEMVKEGRFRSDLYFRLNVIPIELPPLRRRENDVPLLADHFLRKFNRRLNKKIPGFTPAAMEVLAGYPWPGNVRELENLIERLVVLGPDHQVIDEKDLPLELLIHDDPVETGADTRPVDAGLIQARRAFEKQFILRTLERCGWNQSEAARTLRVHRNTLLQKMKSLDLRTEAQDLP